MAIVGTAYVRLRVIGDKLKNDITSATKKAVGDASPELTKSGETAGKDVAKGLEKSVAKDTRTGMEKIADDIGHAIGNAMGEAMGKSLRTKITSGVKKGLAAGKTELTKAKDFFKPVTDKFEKFFGDKSKHFEGIFKKALVTGIGGAVAAAPSILAFLGAAVGAVAATAVTAIAALGPAAAGAALTAVAAFSAIKISAGLIGLAMKEKTPQLIDFHKRLTAFKTTIATPIQGQLLSGFNASLRLLGPVVQSLKPQLAGLGTAVGNVAIGFANAVRQGAMMERIRTILANNNAFIASAGTGVSNLGQAFIVLLSHLGPITSFIGKLIQDIGTWALRTILAAEASGRLAAFVNRMFGSMKVVVGALVDFAVGIANVFHAAWTASGGMIGNLQRTGAAFRAWTGDPANQERMVNFFVKMRAVAAQVADMLKRVVGAALRGLDSTHVDKFTKAMKTIVSLGKPLADAFKQIQAAAGDNLQKLFTNLADVITQLANSGVIGVVSGALVNLFAVLSALLKIPGIGNLLAFGAGLLVIFKTVSLLWTVLGPIIQILWVLVEVIGGALVAAFGWIPVVIGLVVVALIWFFTQTKIGRAIIAAVWKAIKIAIGAAVDGIVAAWNWMVGVFKTVWAWISKIAQDIWKAISTAFNAVVSAVVNAFTTVWSFIVSVWNAVWGFLQPILAAIGGFFASVFTGIVNIVQFVLNVIYQIWIRVFPLLLLPLRIFWGVAILIWQTLSTAVVAVVQWLVGIVSTAWNWLFGVISTVLGAIRDFIVGVWNAVYGFVAGIVMAIVAWVVTRWLALVAGIRAAMSAIWGVIVSVWNAVWGFIHPILSSIGNFISGVWNTIVGAVEGALNRVWGTIKRIWNGIMGFLRSTMKTIGGLVSGAWDMVGNVGQSVLDGLKAAVNFFIGGINGVIEGINWAIGLANKLPGPDIPKIPEIPKLARGGIVPALPGGTLSLIGEAGRSERVEPLDSQGLSVRDRAIIAQLAGSAGGGKGNTISVYIGTRELTQLVDFVVEDREDRLAHRVLTGTKTG